MKTITELARAMADLRTQTMEGRDALADGNALVSLALTAFHDAEIDGYTMLRRLVGHDIATKAVAIAAHAIAEASRLEGLCKEAGLDQNEVLAAAASLMKAEHQILERASDALRHMPAGSKAH